MRNREEELEIALQLILDNIDYTLDACRLTSMVGAALPIELIEIARAALKK